MKLDAAAVRAFLALFFARLDDIHPGFLLLVVPLLVVVVGAAVVALVAILAAAFVVAVALGVILLARRAIHAAATYRSAPEAVTA